MIHLEDSSRINGVSDCERRGANLLQEHITAQLASLRASVYWKDVDGKYLDANEHLFQTTGFHSYQDMIGATDREMSWHKEADTIIENDRRVHYKNATIAIVERVLDDHWLSYKTPLLNRQGKIIGVFGISSQLDLTSSITTLTDEVMLFGGIKAARLLQQLVVDYRRKSLKFTQRQFECLELLSKGMTCKGIGKHLSISHRTVEQHINAAKSKLKCYSRSELIDKFHLTLNKHFID